MKRKISYVVLCCLLLAAVLAVAVACDGNNREKVVVSAEATFKPQAEYARNAKIDLSALVITVTYDDNSTDTLSATSEGVTVEGTDTSVVGTHKLTVKYGEYSWSFDITVRDTVLTLVTGEGGAFADGDKQKTIPTVDNYTSLADYVPTPADTSYEFAGWFYDSEFTRPVNYNFDGKIDTSSDLTLYAGYDIDYSDAFTYSISEQNEVALVTFNQMSPLIGFSDFNLPSTIKLLPVVAIAENFWVDSNVMGFTTYSSLNFGTPSYVREIGKNAFFHSSIKRINFPDTVEYIGSSAFESVEIEQLNFPASLRRIDNSAFEACQYLQEINFAKDSNLEYIGERAFALCGKISQVSIPDSVMTIGKAAFSNNEMLSVVEIGRSVKSIGLHAFSACSNLRQINVNKNNAYYSTIDGNLFSKNGKEMVRYCFGKNEKEYTVPNGVTDIQESAFDCYNMNTTLEKIVLPDTLVSIWAYAFRECEADIEIPASVKNIGDYAFSRNALTSFKVSEDNKTFVVKDGVLYTKDMKELVAVPSNLASDTYTIPASVEKIRSGAMNYNVTVKYIVIPSDSALKYLAPNSIVLGECHVLSGVYIRTNTPFDMAGDALCVDDDMSMSNKNFAVYVNDDVAANFVEAWKNSMLSLAGEFTSEVLLKDFILTVSTVNTKLHDELVDTIGGEFTDLDSFNTALDAYIASAELFGGYYNFERIYRFIDGVYNSDADLSGVTEMLKSFEKKSLEFLVDKYTSYNDRDFGAQQSFYKVIAHYNNIPEAIKADLADTAAKFAPITERTDKFAKLQSDNIAEVAAIVSDYDHWDIDRAQKAYDDSIKYGAGWMIVGSRWSDTLNQLRLHCSIQMYNFLQCDVTVENLAQLRSYLEDSWDENFNPSYGIQFYFDSYFTTDTVRETLYKYDDFKLKYAAMTELITNTNLAMEVYDLANFDVETFTQVLTAFNYLMPGEYSDEAYGIKVLGTTRLYLIDLLSSAVTNENYSEKLVSFSQIENMIMGDTAMLAECGANESDIAAYEQAKTQLLAIFAENNKELIALVNGMTSENFADNIGQLQNLYQQATRTENDLIGLYAVEITIDGQKYSDTLESAIASFIHSQKIIEAAKSFESVTADNWYDFNNALYDPDGIVTYENLMNRTYISYYEGIALTQEIVDHYNELIEQYNSLTSGVWSM